MSRKHEFTPMDCNADLAAQPTAAMHVGTRSRRTAAKTNQVLNTAATVKTLYNT